MKCASEKIILVLIMMITCNLLIITNKETVLLRLGFNSITVNVLAKRVNLELTCAFLMDFERTVAVRSKA